jgi:hypothetical protein
MLHRVFGSGVLALALSGCVGQRHDTLRLNEELSRAHVEAAWQQARAAQLEAQTSLLESRLSRLEQSSSENGSIGRHEESPLLIRLERLLDMNERLPAERAAAPVSSPPSPTDHRLPASAPAATKTSSAALAVAADASTLTTEQLLRALLQSLPNGSVNQRGALTREQENALRILMRPDRKLDTENPWPATLY